MGCAPIVSNHLSWFWWWEGICLLGWAVKLPSSPASRALSPISCSQRLCSSSGRIQRASGAGMHTTLTSHWSTMGWKKASSCCRKPLSRPAALRSGCLSPGSTEKASDPSRFPSTILQPWGETFSLASTHNPAQLPSSAAPQTWSQLVDIHGLTQSLRIPSPRGMQVRGCPGDGHLPRHCNAALSGYSRAQGTPLARRTAPHLTRQGKAQSCCSTRPIFSASVPREVVEQGLSRQMSPAIMGVHIVPQAP